MKGAAVNRWGVKAAGRKFKHGFNLLPPHMKLLNDLVDIGPRLKILEDRGDRHPRVLQHPCAAEPVRHAFHGGALGSIKICHARNSPFIVAL